jgi:hypothetical protein
MWQLWMLIEKIARRIRPIVAVTFIEFSNRFEQLLPHEVAA